MVSNGGHLIEAVFKESAKIQLEASGIEISELRRPAFALRVTEPSFTVDGGYGKLKLRLSIENCQVVRTGYGDTTILPQVSWVPDGWIVREKMLEVLELLQFNTGGPRVSTQSDSPQSIKSQVAHSQDSGPDSEDDICQARFQTQVIESSSHNPPPSPPPVNARVAKRQIHENSELLAQLQRQHQSKTAAETTTTKETVSIPAENSHETSEPRTQASSNDIAPTPLDSISPSLHKPSTSVTPLVQPGGQSGQTESWESEVNGSSVVNNGAQAAEVVLDKKPGMSLNRESATVPQLPNGLIRHFARWRQEARLGRYVPRYVQKIPQDQARLLESDDSWQPALVGRPARQGQVPLPLLERLCEVADHTAMNPQKAENNPNRRSAERERPITASVNELSPLHSNVDSDSEDSQTSIPWSTSPPTQERRARKLPPDSPPLIPRQTKRSTPRLVDHFAPQEQEEEEEDTMRQLRTSTGDFNSPNPGNPTQNDSDEGRHHELISQAEGVHESLSMQSTDERQNPSAGPLTSSAESTSNQTRVPQHIQPRFQTLKQHITPAAKAVQVERTPYIAKDNWYYARSDLARNLDDADLQPSCIPATNYEKTRSHCDEPGADKAPQPFSSGENDKEGPRSADLIAARGSEVEKVPQDAQLSRLHKVSDVVASATPEEADAAANHGADEVPDEPTRAISETRLPESSYASQNALLMSTEHGLVAAAECAPNIQPIEEVILASSHDAQPAVAVSVDHGFVTVEEAATDNQAREVVIPVLEKGVLSSKAMVERDSSPVIPRKRALADDEFAPSKRPRRSHPPAPGRASDPDYASVFEDIRETRRAYLSRIGRPKSFGGQSASSSIKDIGNASDVLRKSPAPHVQNRSAVTAEISPRESTPITPVSAYADVGGHEGKLHPSDSVSQTSAPLRINLHAVFEQFKAAYPDYKGGFGDFEKSYRLLNGLLEIGHALHPFLFDDAICHHFDSYRRYLTEEGANDPYRPMSFSEYYAQRVSRPTHVKGIVTPRMFPGFSSRSHSAASGRSSRRARDSPVVNVPSRLSREEIFLMEEIIMTHGQIAPSKKQMSQSDEVVEQWRHEVSSRASPELGTPDVDRSRSDISMADREVVGRGLSESGSKTSPLPPKNQTTTTVQVALVAPAGAMSKPSLTPQHKERSRLSSSARRGLSSPLVREALSQSPAVKKLTKWWVDSDTPFKRFVKHYGSLPEEKLTRDKVHQATGALIPGGIDICSWRT